MKADFFVDNCYKVSELITKRYSTSFSLASSLLDKEKRYAIYAIYGFVRLADEIVDSFHKHDQEYLLKKLSEDLDYALKNNISTNVLLVAFADTVKKFNIEKAHINSFMESMKSDLSKTTYTNPADIEKYIYGSAGVVGLMCLKIFCDGNQGLYEKLKNPAEKLGNAFQKVNFLRDLKNDMQYLGRTYFTEISITNFDTQSKVLIEQSIQKDFDAAWPGIRKLQGKPKLAVALAYFYYLALFKKIKRASAKEVASNRIRINNLKKYLIIIRVFFLYKFKLINLL